ncbi:MAG: membrane protein [Actinomycetota bacterium]|nr:membrane protein [Actinomycetota bacterium]
MRAPPRLRGPLAARLAILICGLFVFAAGIVALLESGLGLSPWDVLHQGLAEHTRLAFGEANIVVSIVVLAIAWALGARVGVGTLANALLVGGFVQLLTSVEAISALSDRGLGLRIALLAIGIALMGLGTGMYLGAGLGAGPRDSLMVVGAERTQFRIGVVRGALELTALVVGFGLGGTVGIGTLAFALLIGPAVEGSFWLLQRTSLASTSEPWSREKSSTVPVAS